jgi:nitroreductase
MELHSALHYRYATKQFDTTKTLEYSLILECLEAARLAPSAYGLQPYRYLLISDRELKVKLSPVCYNQPQIQDCTYLIVGQARRFIDLAFVEKYIALVAQERQQSLESLQSYKDRLLTQIVQGLSQEAQFSWAQKQLYLSAGVLIAQAALRKVDVCPMEGFSPQGVDGVISGIHGGAYQSSILLAAGLRLESDLASKWKKVRWPLDQLVQEV